ncbi:MAG: hypothetical protein IKP01_02190 [Bacteroidales bacterium]|nr:hypothetical protein [Bacteroidales bacterium]
MPTYCTASQYHAKYIYCDLPDDVLAVWLSDASDTIAKLVAKAGADPDGLGENAEATCLRVCRDMVHRAIGDGSSYMNGMQGSTQFFTSGEDYSQTVNMGNGFADLYIRKGERADIIAALAEDGLTDYGARRAACAPPSFGVFDVETA